jgi:4-carboxymuconolactone decarboxylase
MAYDEDQIRINEKAVQIGEELFGKDRVHRFLDMLDNADKEFSQLFKQFAYAGMYGRSVLDQKIRELCSIAALTVLGKVNQLESHIIAAHKMGASRKEIQEVILQMSLYGGFPVAIEGLQVLTNQAF